MEELRLSPSSSTLQSSVLREKPTHSLNGTYRSILAVCVSMLILLHLGGETT